MKLVSMMNTEIQLIYRSVFSTSGGQYNPGIYESYWSSSGPISEERIG